MIEGQKKEDIVMDEFITKRAVLEAIFAKGALHNSEGSFYHGSDIRQAVADLKPVRFRLTDDDRETIRIHLGAVKGDLCNQGRWEEALEYEAIIERLMNEE